MSKTVIGVGDAKAVKRYSGMLALDVPREMYWGPRFIGKGENAQAPIVQLTELENDAGEEIKFDLVMQLSQQPVEGDNKQAGTEEKLSFYSDSVYIDQQRGGVNSGGKMTRKRTLHKLRKIAKDRQVEWWARLMDETIFIYLSGARGVNADFIYPTSWTGRANNALAAPDSYHIRYAGGNTKATIDSNDLMSLAEVDAVMVKVKQMGGGTTGIPRMMPIQIDGEKHFVLVMNPQQASDMRTATAAGTWLDLQKNLYSGSAKNNPIAKGGLGVYNNVVLHEHDAVIRFSDYGASTPAVLPAARALLLGRQAGAIAFGSPGGSMMRYQWHEEEDDRGNEVVITSSCIWGFTKSTFNSLDFGVFALDTYAAAPT